VLFKSKVELSPNILLGLLFAFSVHILVALIDFIVLINTLRQFKGNQMKLKKYALLGLCVSLNAYAQSNFTSKFKLDCDTTSFVIESNISEPLTEGKIRSVTPFLASFLDTDGYSTSITHGCLDKDDKGQCLSLNNNVFCTNPLPSFKVRSIKSDNSVIMVQNRCDNGYKKFINISYEGNKLIYLEDRMYFMLKNQIHETDDDISFHRPALIFTKTNNDNIALYIEKFKSNFLTDPLPNSVKINLGVNAYSIQGSLHNHFKLRTECKAK